MRAKVNMFRRRWGVIALAVLLGIGAALAVTAVMPGTYSATATLYVVAPVGPDESDSAYESGLLTEQRMKSYIELAESERIAQEVVTGLGLGVTAEALADRVDASSVAGTIVLSLSATDSDPVRAAQIANTAAGSLSALIGQLETRSDTNAPLVTPQIVQPATPPIAPRWPDPVLNLAIGAMVGLGIGVGAMLLQRRYDTSVRNPDELADAMGAPVLGVIARIRRSALPLPVAWRPTSDTAEGYRRVRTNVKYLDNQQRHRAVMITSPGHGDGRTSTVCNLAIAVAQTRRRVLVIDADLRRPGVARMLDLDDGLGLADVLVGNVDLQGALQHWGDGRYLDVLTSGASRDNPSDLLDSPSMIGLLRTMRQHYDLVLVDAPPLLQVTDAAALAPQVDGTVLVVHWGRTKREHVRAAREALQMVSAQVLGVVMTRVPTSAVAYDIRPRDAAPPVRDTGMAETTMAIPQYRPVGGGGDQPVGSPTSVGPSSPSATTQPAPQATLAPSRETEERVHDPTEAEGQQPGEKSPNGRPTPRPH